MVEIVQKYNRHIDNLPNLIKKSYYKAEYFIKHLGLTESTFYRKIREKAFTTKEVETLTELLFPNEVILQHLKESENDIKVGRVEAHEVVKQKLQMKHFS